MKSTFLRPFIKICYIPHVTPYKSFHIMELLERVFNHASRPAWHVLTYSISTKTGKFGNKFLGKEGENFIFLTENPFLPTELAKKSLFLKQSFFKQECIRIL